MGSGFVEVVRKAKLISFKKYKLLMYHINL
jgi:hypothetical protein